MEIKRITEDFRTGSFIADEFSGYAIDNDIELNFEEFCFAAEDDVEYVLEDEDPKLSKYFYLKKI